MADNDSSTGPERILVVEDEQIVALDIRLHLEQFGYTIAAMHAEAETALAYLEENQNALPDVVIMDIHLQGEMDGVEASNIIRERFDIPVIYMTAYADEETLARAKVTEPFAYIIKPFEERELRTALVLATYRHRMNRALRERENILSLVMEAINNGVIVSDATGAVRYANAHAANLVRATLSAGVALEESIPPALVQELRDTVSSGNRTASVRWERISDAGATETIEIRIHQLPQDVPGAVWVLTDLTDRLNRQRAIREQEEQLAYSRRMEAVGRMSGGLAHDFNNLVTIILGYARMALEDMDGVSGSDELRENVQGLYDTAQRSADLTRRLLTVSRLPVGSLSEFPIGDIVEESLPMIEGVLPENIQLQTANNADNLVVRADRRGMQQVLINLLLNARDAMPHGGMVHLTMEPITLTHALTTYNRTLEPGRYVLVSVADTGDGIAPEHLPHVFEPLFTTKDETKGSGFGLATVYSVVADADGAIQVNSTVGQGTRFSIYLPVDGGSSGAGEGAGDAGEHESPTDDEKPEELKGAGRVLVVDEESGVRQMIVNVLRANGYTPMAARSVGDGLLLLGHFDNCYHVITDRSAPYHSTSDIVQLFREKRAGIKVVLMLAGDPLEAGQDATLLKPFDPSMLLRTLQRLN